MNFRNEDILDLNEENIKKLFAYCLAAKDANPENVMPMIFIERGSAYNVPEIYFLTDRIKEKSNTILYLLGQLKVVHDKSLIMSLTDGFFKYDGTIWTQNKMLLFALYYMGNATRCFPLFHVNDDGVFALLADYPELEPTLSPDDSDHIK